MEMNMKTWLESFAYEKQKEFARRHNQFPFSVDRSVFKKTQEEKDMLKEMKMNLPKTRTHKFVKVLHEQF